MSYTDRELLSDIQRLMIEPVDEGLTWLSGLWSLDEVLGYANQRQQRFLADTCLVGGWFQLPALAQEQQDVPEETIFIKHAVFENADGECTPLLPLSRFSADLAVPTWQGGAAEPIGFLFEQTGTTELSLVPPPTEAGLMHLFVVVLAEVLDRSGVLLNVPDEWVPTIRFGILADMLGKQGRAYDASRAQYCEERWQEGVDSAKAVLEALLT